jgi:hypothetical protein
MNEYKIRPVLSAASLALVFILLLSACIPASPTPDNIPDTGSLHTQAAQTVSAQLTLAAGQTAVAQLTQVAAAPSPTQQAAPPTEIVEPDTPVPPSPTPEPTRTPEPASPTPRPCDWAEFVGDVTVTDGTVFRPDDAFTKTWRLRNIGTCTWTTDYDLVFVSGDQMDGDGAVPLEQNVRPGETVDVSVDLIAPEDPDEYLGRWQLRNADGKLFGIGAGRDKPFWVSIKVLRPTKKVWDLAEDFCLASWSTGALDGLACPDLNENTEIGFINRHPFPVLETGNTDDEPALITYPNRGDANTGQGFIQGIFPAFSFRKGDQFRTVIGCLSDSFECNVTFHLNYRTRNGRIHNLASWREKYDEKIHKINFDLSELADREVELILAIENNGESLDDWAFWLAPSVWR